MGRVVDRELNSVIGARLKSMRIERCITRKEVALELGVIWQQIQKYENGTSALSIAAMRKISDLFGVSSCDICKCCKEGRHARP